MQKTAVLALTLVILLSFALTPIHAAELAPGCTLYDFTVSNQGWSSFENATYVAATGWRKTGSVTTTRIELTGVSIPSGYFVSSVRIKLTRSGNSESFDATVGSLYFDGLAVFDGYRTTDAANGTVNRNETGLGVSQVDRLYMGGDGLTTAVVTLQEFEICIAQLAGEYGRPFTSADEDDEWDFFEYYLEIDGTAPPDYDYSVVAFSSDKEAFIHAGFSGTVVMVEKLSRDYCRSVLSSTSVINALIVCQLFVPSEVTGDTARHVYGVGPSVGADYSTGITTPSVLGVWRIVIESATNPTETLEYFARDGNLYAEIGGSVSEGCVLGKAVQLLGISPSLGGLLGVNLSFPQSDKGMTVVHLFDEGTEQELLPYFKSTYPTSSEPCNTPAEYQNCEGGQLLSHPEDWTVSDGASVDNPGATLGSYSYISYNKPFNLDANRLPQVRVNARVVGGFESSMTVILGQTSETFLVIEGEFQDYTVAADDHQPDLAGLYSFQIRNDGENTIEIKYVCISFTLDTNYDPRPDPPPPVCYFQNPSFVNGSEAWTVSGGVSSGEGEIHVPNAETFEQSVHLYTGDYTLRVRGGLRYYVSYVGDETDTDSSAAVEYDYPAVSTWVEIDDITFGDIAQNQNNVTWETTFNLAAETTGTFRFQALLTAPPGDVVGVAIRDVCLYAGDAPGDPFPGYEDPGEPQPELFEETCDVISPPQGNDIGSWISWQWAKLNKFFQCDLMKFLNTQYQSLLKFFKTVLWLARWLMATITQGVEWMDQQFLPWLAGYMTNISPGTVVVGPEEESCDWWNIPCHLTKLVGGILDLGDYFIRKLIDEALGPLVDFIIGTLQRIVDLIFTIISELLSAILQIIINLVFLIVNSALELLIRARDEILDLIFAWNNADPQPLPGMQDCDVSMGNNVVCWFVWLSENTILSGDLGELIIPLFSSLVWILMTIQFAKEIRKMVLRMAGLI